MMAAACRTGTATCAPPVSDDESVTVCLARTVPITSAAGSGGRPLYDRGSTTGQPPQIGDGRISYTVPTGPGTTGGACPARSSC